MVTKLATDGSIRVSGLTAIRIAEETPLSLWKEMPRAEDVAVTVDEAKRTISNGDVQDRYYVNGAPEVVINYLLEHLDNWRSAYDTQSVQVDETRKPFLQDLVKAILPGLAATGSIEDTVKRAVELAFEAEHQINHLLAENS